MGSPSDQIEGRQDADEAPKSDFDRDLGVIEAITIVTRSCPNGGVIKAAEQALVAIKNGGPKTMREQAYFVLTAIKGWRGDRALQVHRSLSHYLDQGTTQSNIPDPANSPRTES